MNIGTITCSYYMLIYGYKKPDPFHWGAMCDKYRAEFGKDDFLKLARQIRDAGFDGIEIWEPTFSHKVYTINDARAIKKELDAIGLHHVVYCIGGWGGGDLDQIEPAYAFAKALGARVVTGCLSMNDQDALLQKMQAAGDQHDVRFAIENHPKPNFEDYRDIAKAIADYPRVGANLDTGIYHSQGYDVLEAEKLLRGRIYHCHLKDTIPGEEGCFPIGDGTAPLAELIRVFKDTGYDHMLSVEFEYDGDPTPGLHKSVGYINGVIKGLSL